MNAKYDYQIDMSADTSHSLILSRINPNSKVLEFGTATGYMTRYLKEELGCTVYGVEIDPQAAKLAERYCVKMIVGDLDRLDLSEVFAGETFDYVLFADVVEHLRNPWQVVKNAAGLLAPNGKVMLSVPNIGHNAILMELLQGRFEYQSTGLLDDTHIRFFTRKSIIELLDKAQLCPVELLGTAAFPEDTEFHEKYASFEEPLQTALKSRTDGHVYQFVIAAKKKSEVKPDECTTVLNVKNLPFTNGFLQVYLNGSDSKEENSVKVPLNETKGFNSYFVNLSGATDNIRLDLVNFPACVEIKAIELFSVGQDLKTAERPIVNWSDTTGFADLQLGSGTVRLESPENLKLLCTDSDPQVFLKNIPPIATELILKVTMQIRRDLHTFSFDELSHQQAVIAGLRQDLTSKDRLITEISKELDSTNGILTDTQLRLERIMTSRTWIWATKARRVVRAARRLSAPIRAVFGGGYRQGLIPLAHVRSLDAQGLGNWEAVDSDPQLLLSGPWPEGWTEVTWEAASEYPIKLRLYFDRGRGFNEIESLDLDVVNGEEPTRYSVIVPVGRNLKSVRLDPGEGLGQFIVRDFKMAGISRMGIIRRAAERFIKANGSDQAAKKLLIRRLGGILLRQGPKGLWLWAKGILVPKENYELWLKYNTLTTKEKADIKQKIERLAYKPAFSIIVPVYNVEEKWLRACLESVRAQLYPYWELCIADDASTDPNVKKVLEEYSKKDSRIKVVYRPKNGHISAASNSALELATGEYIALLDNDDLLTVDALYENAVLINEHRDADMIYSDEDKIEEDGRRHSAFFKPDWSPDNLLGQMYTCHFGVYRAELVRRISGFRLGFEGSQDHDLVLRLTEQTDKIYHIPKILYHWRTIAQSTAANPGSKSYATIAGEKAVQEALDRRGEGGWVESLPLYPGHYLVHYPVKDNPLISILIPTKDMADLLGSCLESIFNKTTYTNFEVIVIDNGSKEQKTFELFKKWEQAEPKRFKVLRLDIPFNYSRLNNEAAKLAQGRLIMLLNNDVEVISENWLEEMAGQALRPSIGAVGVKLLYEDGTIQHAGVTLGVRGVGDHTHRGRTADEPGYFGRLVIVSDNAAVTAACLMLRKEVFAEVGGLDEKLQVAFNDVDFCLKILSRGYYNVLLPHVKLYHYESKSRGYEDTPEKMERFLGEVALMQDKWGGILKKDPFYNPNLTLDKEDYTVAIPGK